MDGMDLQRAVAADYPAVVELANLAYRGSDEAGWCSEAGIVAGLRLTEAQLREHLAPPTTVELLLLRGDGPESPLLGTVWLEPEGDGAWYLGLLTVRPAMQNRQLGRRLLAAAEQYAQQRGATRIRMTVVNVRDTLIAWYERRGYTRTGETKPFPYGDDRFGTPLRDGLEFVVMEKAL